MSQKRIKTDGVLVSRNVISLVIVGVGLKKFLASRKENMGFPSGHDYNVDKFMLAWNAVH